MSDNLHYRAIQSLYNEIIEAISPEVDILISKCWSKEIIGKQQLNLSLEPNIDARHKAGALISALISRLSQDSTAFEKFISLLNEEPSLKYMADSLTREVEHLMSSSQPSRNDTSISGSSPRRNRRLSNELPKLDLAEGESGFIGEEGHDLGPIAGEELLESASGSSTTDMTLIPESESLYKSFRKVEGGDSLGGGAGVLVKQDEEENLNVRSPYMTNEEDVSPIEAAGESTRDLNEQDEMVFPCGQQSKASSDSTTGDQKILDSVDTILKESEKKNTRILNLEEELRAKQEQLAATQLSEAQLIEQVEQLSEENQQLRYELQSKEAEQKHTREELEREIESLKSQLQEKEKEVDQARAQLAKAEQQNELLSEPQRKIEQLEEEKRKLKDEFDKLSSSSKEMELTYRDQILVMREKLVDKTAEEAKLREQLGQIKVKLVECQLELERTQSQATIDSLKRDIELHKSSSVPKYIHEAKMAEAAVKIDCLESMLKKNSISPRHPSTPLYRNQSSLTESAGRPSPSTSDPDSDPFARQGSATESLAQFNIEPDEDKDDNPQNSN